MDTTTVLDKYTQDLSNLPLEVKHLLQELKNKDVQLQETRKRCQTKDSQIHKFIRANGTLTKHPKEQQLYAKIEEDMISMKKLQKEKILLANTALFLILKHLCNFETDISKLEKDGMLPVVENLMELDNGSESTPGLLGSFSDMHSGTSTPKPADSSTIKRTQKKNKHRNSRPLVLAFLMQVTSVPTTIMQEEIIAVVVEIVIVVVTWEIPIRNLLRGQGPKTLKMGQIWMVVMHM